MLRKSFLLISTLFSTLAFSQEDSTVNQVDSLKGSIDFNTFYDISSNTITAGMFRKIYQGQFIDHNDKIESSLGLNGNNRFGAEIATSIKWTSPKSVYQTWHPTVSMGHRQIASIGFSDDFYNLVFHGNTRFKGETAELSNTTINYLSYQDFSIGLSKKSETTEFIFSVGLIKGSQGIFTQITNGELFTAEDGTHIDFNVNADMSISDSNNVSLSSWSGTGFLADVAFNYNISDNQKLHFSLSDIGHIAWNDNSASYRVDSSFHFEGLVVDNIFSLSDSVFQIETNGDSLINQYEMNSGYTSIIPARVKLMYSHKFNNVGLHLGADYLLNAAYLPHLQMQSDYQINEIVKIAINLGYGGFTNFHYGLGVGFETKKFDLNLLGNAADGLISNKGLTQSATLQFRYKL